MHMPTEATRAYIYRVLVVLQPILIGYGALSNEQWTLWIAVVGAILGQGLASANTSTKKS